MTFIANTRQKKLKKLFLISRNLIKQHGFRYSFRIFYEEFFKQKKNLFKPDDVPKLNFEQFISDYEIFKQKHMLTPYKLELAKNRLSEMLKKPSFTFIILNFENSPDLSSSVNSILNQIYDNFDIIVVNNSKNIINLDELGKKFKNDKIQLIQNNSNSKKLNEIIFDAKGDFIAILDAHVTIQNDLLYNVLETFNQNSSHDIFYTDEDFITENNNRKHPFFKPDWSPNLFFSMNYLGQFFIVKKSILKQIKKFKFHTSQDFIYDLILRCTELTKNISHIPLPLFSTKNANFTFSKSIKSSLTDHFEKIGIDVHVQNGSFPNTYKIIFKLDVEPKVSIIIPTKDKEKLLRRCIQSIEKNTVYKNWEIIIVDNNSSDKKTIDYLESLPYKIIKYTEPFNFSKINNFAVTKTVGDYLLFLNDDTAVLEKNWLTEMVSICKQKSVGIVGSKLVHSDASIQHAGMVFLKSGSGFHPFQRFPENDSGYFNFINLVRDFSAVTGACLLIKKSIFNKIDGFDDDFDLYYGDADLCLKVRKLGFDVVYTPNSKLLHEGSTSIKKHSDAFFAVENHYRFIKKWPYLKNGDPFYNSNLGWNYAIEKSS